MNNISPLKLLVLLKQSEIENPEKISNFVEKYLKFVFMVFGFLMAPSDFFYTLPRTFHFAYMQKFFMYSQKCGVWVAHL